MDCFLELLLIKELQDEKHELPTQGRHCSLFSPRSHFLHLCVCCQMSSPHLSPASRPFTLCPLPLSKSLEIIINLLWQNPKESRPIQVAKEPSQHLPAPTKHKPGDTNKASTEEPTHLQKLVTLSRTRKRCCSCSSRCHRRVSNRESPDPDSPKPNHPKMKWNKRKLKSLQMGGRNERDRLALWIYGNGCCARE